MGVVKNEDRAAEEFFKLMRSRVDQALIQGFKPDPVSLPGAIHYALSLKAKRLRPLLFLSTLQAGGCDPEEGLDIACGIEMIHTYSLIHDDLPAMDNDDFRRGMPTVHKQFNEALALLAGDTLLTIAMERIANCRLPAETVVNIQRILTRSIGLRGMAGGQALDLAFSGNRREIFRIHRQKTADLIQGSLLAAAEIINLDPKKKTCLARAGTCIGIAFQITDDRLDMEGDEKLVGKKLRKDSHNKSPNAFVYYDRSFLLQLTERLHQRALFFLDRCRLDSHYLLVLFRKMVSRDS